MWESEFCYLWQQQICHCVCSLVYIYTTATKSRVDWLLWLRISDNLYTCLMLHSFYINKPLNFLPFFHNSNNIWWQVQFMKLYIMQIFPLLLLQPAVGFGLWNNISPFVPIYLQLSPSSHSQHLKISFHFFSPSFPGSSSSSRPFQILSEHLFGHPILLHSHQVTQPTYPLFLYPLYYIFSFIQLF